MGERCPAALAVHVVNESGLAGVMMRFGGSYETAPPTSSIAPPSGLSVSLGEVVAPAVAVRETRAMEHDRREKADVARSLHDSTLAGGLIGLAVAAAAFFAAHVLRRRRG